MTKSIDERLTSQTDADVPSMKPLDLQRDIDRFGADTVGGVGISRVA